jgi:hypothetical protein
VFHSPLNLFGNSKAQYYEGETKFSLFCSEGVHILSASIHRWDVLKSRLQPRKTVKKLMIQGGLQEPMPFWFERGF